MEQIYQLPGATLHLIKTDKFKNTKVMIRFITDLTTKKAAHRAMLSYLLVTGTRELNSAKKLSAYLDNLYDMSLATNVQAVGKSHIFSLTTTALDQQYVDEPLLEKQIKILSDVLFNPNASKEKFDELMFEVKKRELIANVKSLDDDKIAYGVNQLLRYMGDDNYLGIRSIGNLETIEAITNEATYQTLQEMISNDQKHIYIVGNVDDQGATLVKKYFNFPEVTTKYDCIYPFIGKHNGQKQVEIQDIAQAKINLGYDTGVTAHDQDYYPMYLFNYLLGGSSQSRLFKIVRESNSLCYYISSIYQSSCGVMAIIAGTEIAQSDQAITLIKEQVTAMQQGKFSDDDLALAKKLICANVDKATDSLNGLLNTYAHNDLLDRTISPAQLKDKINAVTKDEIVAASQKVRLDTIYLLQGEKANG